MSTPPLNPISLRLPSFDLSTEEGRQAAHRYVASGIVDLNQAIAALKQQLTTTQATAKVAASNNSVTSSGVTSFNTLAGNVTYFPFLGMVNDQLGNAAYLTQATDNGVKLIVGDSTPVAVTLNAGVPVPWFLLIDNDSGSMTNLTTTSGRINGPNSILPGGFGAIFFDGVNFWCGATVMATDSTPGYVQPDAVTIGIDSGLLHTVGPSGTIPLGPLTDSGATGAIHVSEGLITSWLSPT